jgi:hypothetical protein
MAIVSEGAVKAISRSQLYVGYGAESGRFVGTD